MPSAPCLDNAGSAMKHGKLAAMRYLCDVERPKIVASLGAVGRREPRCRQMPDNRFPNMPAPAFEKFIWPVIFGGLFAVGIGVFIDREGSALGWPITVAGGLAVVVGAVLIWLRSRIEP